MNKILIPLDGSELAEAALDPTIRLAARHDAGVVLASVVSDLPPVPLAAGDGDLVASWFDEEKERANTYLDRIREQIRGDHPELEVETRVEMGPVVSTLLGEAGEAGADLVALTTHGRGAWQRAWLGSVADGLVRRAERPVLLLRGGDRSRDLFADDTSPSRVIVPLDGSRASEQILSPLTSLLPSKGGRVTLVSVLLRPFPLATTYLPHAVEETNMMEERERRSEEYLKGVAESWDPLGVDIDTRVIGADDVAKALLELIEEEEPELLALSTRGRGGVSRFVLGSVADKLVRGADLPVLAVRRPPEND